MQFIQRFDLEISDTLNIIWLFAQLVLVSYRKRSLSF